MTWLVAENDFFYSFSPIIIYSYDIIQQRG